MIFLTPVRSTSSNRPSSLDIDNEHGGTDLGQSLLEGSRFHLDRLAEKAMRARCPEILVDVEVDLTGFFRQDFMIESHLYLI